MRIPVAPYHWLVSIAGLNFDHFNRYEVIFHYGFSFPDDSLHWVIFICILNQVCLYVFFCDVSVQVFCHLKNLDCLTFYWYVSVLFIQWYKLSDTCVLNSVSWPVVYLFILLMLSFDVQKFLILVKVKLSIFSFYSYRFCVFSIKLLPIPRTSRYYVFKSFIILAFMSLWSTLNNFCVWSEIEEIGNFFSPILTSSCSRTICLKPFLSPLGCLDVIVVFGEEGR